MTKTATPEMIEAICKGFQTAVPLPGWAYMDKEAAQTIAEYVLAASPPTAVEPDAPGAIKSVDTCCRRCQAQGEMFSKEEGRYIVCPDCGGDGFFQPDNNLLQEVVKLREENARLKTEQSRIDYTHSMYRARAMKAEAENAALKEMLEGLEAAVTNILHDDDPSLPDEQMTGARISFGQMRKLIAALAREGK